MKKLTHCKCTAALSVAAIMATSLPLIAVDTDRRETRSQAQQQQDRMSLVQPERLNKILGSQVRSSDRERVGKLNNIVLDLESGHVLFAIIGTSDGRVAVPPGVFESTRGDDLRLNITKAQLAKAPKVEKDMSSREELGQASFVNRVHEQFGQHAWWKGENSADTGSFNNVQAGESLIGMKVRNVMDKDIGEVRNAVLDLRAGRVVYVAIDPNKDMNLGNKLFALPPSALTLGKDRKSLVSDVDREKLNSGPSFTSSQWPSLTDSSFASRVYSHYGKRAYFESGAGLNLQPTGRDSDSERNFWRNRDRDRDRDRDVRGNKDNRNEADDSKPDNIL